MKHTTRLLPRVLALVAGTGSLLRLPVLLLIVMAVLAVADAWQLVSQPQAGGIDFYQYWVVAQAVRSRGATDIYSAAERVPLARRFYEEATRSRSPRYRAAASGRYVVEAPQTPFLYTLFAAVVSHDYEADLSVYQLVSFGCVLATALALCCALRFPAEATLAIVIVLFQWFPPCRSDARVGNVNRLLLGLLMAFVWSLYGRQRAWKEVVGGGVLGLAVMFKPTLAFVVLLFPVHLLLAKRYRHLLLFAAGTGASALAAGVVSCLALGSGTAWSRWARELSSMPDSLTSAEAGNYSLPALIQWGTGLHLARYLVVACLGVAVAVLWFTRRRAVPAAPAGPGLSPEPRFIEDALVAALGVLVILLSSPLAWLHYFVLLILAILLELRPGAAPAPAASPRRERPRQLLTCLALAALCSSPLLKTAQAYRPVWHGCAVAGATVLLFALVLWDLAGLRRLPAVDGLPPVNP